MALDIQDYDFEFVEQPLVPSDFYPFPKLKNDLCCEPLIRRKCVNLKDKYVKFCENKFFYLWNAHCSDRFSTMLQILSSPELPLISAHRQFVYLQKDKKRSNKSNCLRQGSVPASHFVQWQRFSPALATSDCNSSNGLGTTILNYKVEQVSM